MVRVESLLTGGRDVSHCDQGVCRPKKIQNQWYNKYLAIRWLFKTKWKAAVFPCCDHEQNSWSEMQTVWTRTGWDRADTMWRDKHCSSTHIIVYITTVYWKLRKQNKLLVVPNYNVSRVSIASGYGLDDRAIEVRYPAKAKGFSSNICVQTGSGANPASCTVGIGGPFPGGKALPGRDADHSPHLVANSRMSSCHSSFPPKRLRGV
jgi:hypothetical protein